LSFAPAVSSAAFVATTAISGTSESPTLAALDLLSVAAAQPIVPSATSFTFSESGGRAFATSTVSPRSDTDAFLWALLNITRAQRDSQHFDLVVNTASYVLSQTVLPPPSAVPLPGTVWLFLTGLLGLAGTRLSGLVGGAGLFLQRKGASPVDAPSMPR
jgi:hypothetical protein